MIFRSWGRGLAITVGGFLSGARPAFADAVELEDDDGLSGLSPAQIDALLVNFDEVVETIALYSALSATLVILLGLSVFLRLTRWATYVALTMISMAWLAWTEQHGTNQFWLGVIPGEQGLITIGFGLASLHILVASASIRPGEALAWARPLLVGAAGLIWLVWWGGEDTGRAGPPGAFLWVAGFACLSHLFAVPSFLSLQGTTSSVTRNGTVFALVLTTGALIAILFGELDEEIDSIFLLRLGLLALTAFFVIFFVRHVLSLLFERDANAQLAIATAQKESRTAKALLEAEQNYAKARQAAQRHTRRLAEASHDIRQPIASLRMTMDAIARDQPAETRTHLKAAFDYMDRLARSYVDGSSAATAPEPRADSPPDGSEIVEAGMIVATLDRMFRSEAEGKGLAFSAAAEEAPLHVPPLLLTRVLANLLSNAIQHTPQGNIRLTGQAEERAYRFSVVNSAALPQDVDGQDMFEPFAKGRRSAGTGLGLSIVDRLTRQLGWDLTWSSDQTDGTRFNIRVPAELPPDAEQDHR